MHVLTRQTGGFFVTGRYEDSRYGRKKGELRSFFLKVRQVVCVLGWFYLGANAFHVSQAFRTRLGPGSDGHEIFNLPRHLTKEILLLPE